MHFKVESGGHDEGVWAKKDVYGLAQGGPAISQLLMMLLLG